MRTSPFRIAIVAAAVLHSGCGKDPARDGTTGGHKSPAARPDSPPLKFIQDGAKKTLTASAALDVFNQRILPIFNSEKPSSCTECHLSGVELKDYIQPDQEQTFAALVAAELIDVESPDESRILKFIERSADNSPLMTQEVRRQEHEAFRAWIHAATADPKLLAAKPEAKIGPSTPVEVIRHGRADRVLESFVDNVWSEVLRCAACHSPDRNQKQVEKFGEQVSWIQLGDPRATMDYLLEAELVNLDDPKESKLLTKPTLQEEHGGGQKLMIGDRTYKQFLRFINDYAAVARGEYQAAGDLPAASTEISEATDIWLKITGVPSRFDKLLLRAAVYPWDEKQQGWSKELAATADRAIFGPNQLWQNHLTLTAPRGSERGKSLRREVALPEGRYLVRIYIDERGELANDFATELGEGELVGQVELHSRWPAGYGQMTEVKFP